MTQSWTTPASDHGYVWVMQAWTLSIEAVFYLIFPLVYPLLRDIGNAALATMLAVCALVIVIIGTPSIAPGTIDIELFGTNTFVPLPLFRMAEFGFGAALCILHLRAPQWFNKVNPDIAEAATLAGIMLVLSFAESVQTKAIFAILAGLLIFFTASGRGIISRVLSNRWLILLGGASYSLYLLQAPVRAWCAMLIPTPFDRFASPAITISLAVLVFLFVEEPARRSILFHYKRIWGVRPSQQG
ncbi:acyltransferase family protein [Asticcacaulis sp. W401b]|uniref:acyltransferase family protein n=1 Tax=Asticcacaulis sp. W401b TaxID=3388666 RepID=UPI0039707C3D